MFYNYKVVDDVLYLFVDDKCEIGSFFSSDKNELIDKVKDYIKRMRIKFDGAKVVLLISGLMLGTVYLNGASEPAETKGYVYSGDKYVYGVVNKDVPKLDQKTINETVEEIIGSKHEETVTESSQSIAKKDNVSNKKHSSSASSNSSGNNASSNQGTINNNGNSSNQNQNNTPTVNETMVTLRRSNGSVITIGLEEYLVGVVSAEMPASFNTEALKAQAVVARTYTLKLIESGRTLTDNVSTQAYKSDDELRSMWGSSFNKYYNKVKQAVYDTKSLCVKYQGRLIDAVYHSTSNGYTEDAVNVWGNSVPYLKSVTSPWDTTASSFLRESVVSFDKISSVLGMDFNSDSLIEIISRDASNRITRVRVNNKEYSGVQLRNFLGLRSADFDVSITPTGIVFTTRGYGHGVGMSQYGANGMANSGYSFEQILKHYYTGVTLSKM